MKPKNYKFIPYPEKPTPHYIRRPLLLCERCCFYHTDHLCMPCRSEKRTDGKDGYWIIINH